VSAEVSAIEARLDPRQVLASLGYPQIDEPVRVRGGWDTLLWRFRGPEGRAYSLRVLHMAEGEEFARRERLAFAACAAAGVPAPRLEASGTFEGLPALVLTWCPGRPLLSSIEKRPWSLWRLSRLFGRMQARVHAVAPPPELAEGAPEDWLSRVGEEHRRLVEPAKALRPVTSSLIHMDFHPLNVVSDGRAITGVVDWSRAAAGDPRADLARTEVTLLSAPAPPGPAAPLLNLTRKLMIAAWRSGYREEAGALPDFQPWRAWAGATLLAEEVTVIDSPGVWGTAEDVERLRGLIDRWAAEAAGR
jgi:aminoglycoside phosphotransferase (APT) family kinase protein